MHCHIAWQSEPEQDAPGFTAGNKDYNFNDGTIVVDLPQTIVMDKDKNQEKFRQSQKGTGSAENIGRARKEQKNRTVNLGQKQKQNIARETGLSKRDIADTGDLGGLSGRDDYAGGDNEGMSKESTNERTDV